MLAAPEFGWSSAFVVVVVIVACCFRFLAFVVGRSTDFVSAFGGLLFREGASEPMLDVVLVGGGGGGGGGAITAVGKTATDCRRNEYALLCFLTTLGASMGSEASSIAAPLVRLSFFWSFCANSKSSRSCSIIASRRC